MIYNVCYCNELIKKIVEDTKLKIQKLHDKMFNKDIDFRKFKRYSTVNNLEDNVLQVLLTLSNEYQEKNYIQDMCLTNSILFKTSRLSISIIS